MGLFTRPDSPFWWALLEGTNRRKVNTRIPHFAITAEKRRELKIEAEAIYHKLMVDAARRGVGLPTKSAVTFLQFAEWYDTNIIATHKGIDSEQGVLKNLKAFFGQTLLRDIRPALVSEYQALRTRDGIKPSTLYREVRFLRTMLNRAIGEHFDASPLANFRQRKVKLKPKRTITFEEEPALLTELLARDAELHDIYVVAVGTLLRQENVATLTRAALRGRDLVVDTKAGPHTISLTGPTPLQTRAYDVLMARKPKEHTGWFFPHWGPRFTSAKSRGGPRSRFRDRFQQAVEAAGLPWGLEKGGLVWHSATRATGATRMLRDYHVDVRTVQLRGPWASLDQMADYLGIPMAVNTTGTAPPSGMHTDS